MANHSFESGKVLISLLVVLGVLLACKSGKDDSSPAPAPAPVPVSSATVATTASAAASASAAATATAKAGKKKVAGKAGSKPLGKAARGGGGSTRPTAQSKKTSVRTMGLGDAVNPAPDPDPCDDLADRTAECDGKKIYYCQDHNLEVLDCNKMAKEADYTSGDCFESDSARLADCLGCDVDDDGSAVCCDFGGLICCDNSGNCYDPAD